MWGKVKTVLQMLTVLFYYFAAALAGPTDVMAVGLITQIFVLAVRRATVLSGGIYLWQNRSLFMQAKINPQCVSMGADACIRRSMSIDPYRVRVKADLQGLPIRNPPTCQSSISVHFLNSSTAG